MAEVKRSEAVARLWNLGILHWKLEKVQKDLYDTYQNARDKTTVWLSSRRLGKSYVLCCLAIETCLKKRNQYVKFVAPTQKHVKMIIGPIMKEIFQDCPEELRPEYRTADNIYRFPNGSEIQLAGTDNGHAENLRGGDAHLCIIDEAGFCDGLRYIVQSILIPTTTITRGKIILSSTPPISRDHEFCKYIEEAELKGNFVKKTIYDAIGNRITQEIIDEIIQEFGGENSPEFRREYLCELITSEDISVVPEFNERLKQEIVKEWKKPPFFDAYVSGDIGAKDFTVFLFGYYDFRGAKLIIEDEVVLKGGMTRITTDLMAKEIKATEARIWTNPYTGEQLKPYKRVCDNDLIVINNLYEQNNLIFLPTEKSEAISALNNMRILLKEGRIIINPKCKTLIQHLTHATWEKNKKRYSRDAEFGHYDAIPALVYMVRNIQFNKNPYPSNHGQPVGDNWWESYYKQDPVPTPLNQTLKTMYKVKSSVHKFKRR